MSLQNRVRLISGLWKGRYLSFPDALSLRPTPLRLRETLFNWLMPVIRGARCLDVFAGSGALGFEAASRGAKEVFLIDQNPLVIAALKKNISLLKASDTVAVQMGTVPDILKTLQGPFDFIFLDPPFASEAHSALIDVLVSTSLLAPGTFIYIETDSALREWSLPSNWHLKKESHCGRVKGFLLEVE